MRHTPRKVEKEIMRRRARMIACAAIHSILLEMTGYFLGLMARIVRTLRLSSYPRLPVSEVGYIWHEDKGNNLQMGKYN